MKKLFALLMISTFLCGSSAFAEELPEENTPVLLETQESEKAYYYNVAKGKTVYGAQALFGSGDGAALIDGDVNTYTLNGRWENYTDLAEAFVIDLGEDYAKYDVDAVKLTTPPSGVWVFPNYIRNYNVFMADSLLIYDGKYYTREETHGEMVGIGAVKLGFVEDISAAKEAQTTYTIEANGAETKRYIIISHEIGVSSYLTLAEAEVMAYTDEPEPVPEPEPEPEPEENTQATSDITGCENIALGKTVLGATDGAALVDGSYSSYTSDNATSLRAWEDLSMVFVIDLGENYDGYYYDFKQVRITSMPASAASTSNVRKWNVWTHDSLPEVYNGFYLQREQSMISFGATKIGWVRNCSDALDAQQTYSFDIDPEKLRRYIIVGHEVGDPAIMTLAEVEVFAKVYKEYERKQDVEISSFKFCNNRNREITDLSDVSRDVGAIAVAKNISDSKKTLYTIVALYNEKNTIEEMMSESYELEPGASATPKLLLTPTVEIKPGYSLKAFYWVSDEYLKPYMLHKTLEHNPVTE